MRVIVNLVILLMLIGLLAGAVYLYQLDRDQVQAIDATRTELRRLQQQVKLQATLSRVELSDRGYPVTIDPAWFEHDRPINVLLGSRHPWVEIAHEDQSHLKHPVDPVAHDRDQAQFWYNPSTGLVRARVPARPSDQTTLDLYNLINDSHLTSLFDMTRETPPVLEPVPSRGRPRRR
ncbi:MAG: hypothetical protein EA377_13890 [Phycisphaerales bacterium]|nr:MAG: hypothetical protein EA377_13890 [Phycisphaerales bacterium]